MNQTFTENLKGIMAEKGVTNSKLAEMTGINLRIIYKYRTKTKTELSDPSAYNLKRLAKALGVSMDDLYGDI